MIIADTVCAPSGLSEAACRGMHNLFFPKIDSSTWELRTERKTKQVCSTCPCVDACWETATMGDAVIPGVYAGTNQWERRWIIENPEECVELAALLEKENVDPQELRRLGAMIGTKDADLTATVSDLSQKWGYPTSTVAGWRTRAGAPPRKKPVALTPWGQKIRDALSEAHSKGEWTDRVELVNLAESFIPQEKIENLQNAKYRNKCSKRTAVDYIVDRVLRGGLRHGLWEQRRCPETGRVQLRIIEKKGSLAYL